MTVKLIVAVDRGNAIGWSDGRLPWKISADLKRFKELTTGSTVLMGYNTYTTLPAMGLPNRTNVVISRSRLQRLNGIHGVSFFNDLESFVRLHQQRLAGPPDLWVIGGAQIYGAALQLRLVDEIYLTLVDVHSGADIKLQHDLSAWKLFVLQQAKVGVQWYLDSLGDPQLTPDGVRYTFITLKRTL